MNYWTRKYSKLWKLHFKLLAFCFVGFNYFILCDPSSNLHTCDSSQDGRPPVEKDSKSGPQRKVKACFLYFKWISLFLNFLITFLFTSLQLVLATIFFDLKTPWLMTSMASWRLFDSRDASPLNESRILTIQRYLFIVYMLINLFSLIGTW